ncbi:glycine-rich protein-like [Panicum miliaceum]|uniref:Glycine-rich protein-like n=1 Tax=Panicum miliaceum TaxID=4540 RepID=A0A3L6SF83_PANMI|nr:glycine-rich protein-like [Panicum miliaceum]
MAAEARRSSAALVAAAAVVALLLVLAPEASRAERFVVGDAARWTWGYNYTDWVIRKGPFFQNDTLVFMYDPPNATVHAHSVYMMRNAADYQSCNLKAAKLVAGVMQGAGSGFEFVLRKRKTHYFVCGERGGIHCTMGQMKFIVKPKSSACRD